jgi:hypothetical protein
MMADCGNRMGLPALFAGQHCQAVDEVNISEQKQFP